MAPPKTARWLDLLAYLLQYRFPVTREQIFEAIAGYAGGGESARRTFERDKDELRALGIQLETVALPNTEGDEPASGYRLRARDLYLPYLELQSAGPGAPKPRPYRELTTIPVSDDDLALLDRATRRVAALAESPLAPAGASARAKLAFDVALPMATVERLLAHPLAGDAARALEVLQRAVASRVAVQCRYYAIGRDAEEERVIEPWGLFFSWGRWYCVAHSRERNARRVFRVDRMSAARTLAGPTAAFQPPADFSIQDYVGRAPWDLSEAPPVRVVVRFGFPESRWVLAQGLGEPVDALLDDGGARLVFAVRDRGPFLRWLLTFRTGLVVEEPADVAAELVALRRKVVALYAAEAP